MKEQIIKRFKEGLGGIRFQYEQHRTKFLEVDIKISEIFIFSTSVIIVYLSTFKEVNLPFFIAIFSFFGVIILSIASMWDIRNVHRKLSVITGGAVNEFYDALEKFERGEIEDSNFGAETARIREKYTSATSTNINKVRSIRNRIDILQFSCLLFFINGLFFTLSIKTWWNVFSENLRIGIITGFWFLLFGSFIFYIYIKFLYKSKGTNKSDSEQTPSDSG